MPRFVAATETTLLPALQGWLEGWKKTTVKERLRHGAVRVNEHVVTHPATPLRPGDVVEVDDARQRRDPSRRDRHGIGLLYDDPDLAVIDKPAGLLTVATAREVERTVMVLVAERLRAEGTFKGRLHAVHRLDRETSGLLIVAKNAEVRAGFREIWPTVEKTYVALVHGVPNPPARTVTLQLVEGQDMRVRVAPGHPEAREAVTHFDTLEVAGDFARLDVRLGTGRKHQIRVSLAALGHPIVGDAFYGVDDPGLGRLGLHAWRLSFRHPRTGQALTLESPLPPQFERFMRARRRP